MLISTNNPTLVTRPSWPALPRDAAAATVSVDIIAIITGEMRP